MSKKRGLNQGRVDMLLSEALGFPLPDIKEKTDLITVDEQAQVFVESETKSKAIAEQQKNNGAVLQQIPLSKLMPGRFQPRRVIQEEELKDLAESIKKQGVLQPIVVREYNDKFEVIAGERRWRAASLAGLQNTPVIVREINDEEAMVIALVENIQRENLNPLEEAYALERLSKEFGLTHEETAKAVGKSRATISNLLRLLTLHGDVKALLERGELDLGHAKVLLAVEGKKQSRLAKMVVEKRLSVRETERLVQQKQPLAAEDKHQRPLDPDIARLQRSLSEKVGSPIRIFHSLKGRGKVVIKYNSIDELDGILEHIV